MQTASMKKKTSDEITKTTFKKLWGWLTYPDWTRRKHPLAKNLPLSANWWGDISTVMLWWLHINPSKTGLDHKRYNPISPPIYTNRMVFLQGGFSILLLSSEYANKSHYSTNLNFCDVTFLDSILHCNHQIVTISQTYQRRIVCQQVWYDNTCTCKCEILIFLHQGKGVTKHLYKIFSFSTMKIKQNIFNFFWLIINSIKRNI